MLSENVSFHTPGHKILYCPSAAHINGIMTLFMQSHSETHLFVLYLYWSTNNPSVIGFILYGQWRSKFNTFKLWVQCSFATHIPLHRIVAKMVFNNNVKDLRSNLKEKCTEEVHTSLQSVFPGVGEHYYYKWCQCQLVLNNTNLKIKNIWGMDLEISEFARPMKPIPHVCYRLDAPGMVALRAWLITGKKNIQMDKTQGN